MALVEVPRFRAALERRGERLLVRVFSPAELEYAGRKKSGWQNLAARFAANYTQEDGTLRLSHDEPSKQLALPLPGDVTPESVTHARRKS